MNKLDCFCVNLEEFEFVIINLFFILQLGNRNDINLWTSTLVEIYCVSYLQNVKKYFPNINYDIITKSK